MNCGEFAFFLPSGWLGWLSFGLAPIRLLPEYGITCQEISNSSKPEGTTMMAARPGTSYYSSTVENYGMGSARSLDRLEFCRTLKL